MAHNYYNWNHIGYFRFSILLIPIMLLSFIHLAHCQQTLCFLEGQSVNNVVDSCAVVHSELNDSKCDRLFVYTNKTDAALGLNRTENQKVKDVINSTLKEDYKEWLITLIILPIGLIGIELLRLRGKKDKKHLRRKMKRLLFKVLKFQRRTYFIIRESGKDIKLNSTEVLFVKSAGNYLEIHTEKGKHVIRKKISNFLDIVPDPIEYLRVHRSYIVRLDKIEVKGVKTIAIKGNVIGVGHTYHDVMKLIEL